MVTELVINHTSDQHPWFDRARNGSTPSRTSSSGKAPTAKCSPKAIFLRNHDELTLEMVAPEEREFMYGHYAKDARMRINVGILPGSPVMYYGDEIGMGDNVYLGDRNGVRTPMQWSADRNGGFSESDNAALYFPVINDPPYGYQMANVDAQERSQSSLLNWVRAIVALRGRYHAFGRGTFEPIAAEDRRVLAFISVNSPGGRPWSCGVARHSRTSAPHPTSSP
ncbi:hypothetical protein BH11GEM1_BH11GEM1_32110 [soil metagenome]